MNIAVRYYTRSGNTKKLADAIVVADEEFHCRGQFGKMHKGRPNMDDLNKVSAFAKRVIGR